MKNKSRYMAAAIAVFVLVASIAGCEKTENTEVSVPEVTAAQSEAETTADVTTVAETAAETTGITTTVSETVTITEQTTEQTTTAAETTTEEVTAPVTETEATEPETEAPEQTLSCTDDAKQALLGRWTLRSYVNMTYKGYEFHEDGTWEAIPIESRAENDPEYAANMPKGTWCGANGGRGYYAYAMYDENGDLYYGIQIYTDDMGYETLERGDGMCFYNGKEHTPEE